MCALVPVSSTVCLSNRFYGPVRDRQGKSAFIKTVGATRVEECAAACDKLEGCRLFSFRLPFCKMFNGMETASAVGIDTYLEAGQ